MKSWSSYETYAKGFALALILVRLLLGTCFAEENTNPCVSNWTDWYLSKEPEIPESSLVIESSDKVTISGTDALLTFLSETPAASGTFHGTMSATIKYQTVPGEKEKDDLNGCKPPLKELYPIALKQAKWTLSGPSSATPKSGDGVSASFSATEFGEGDLTFTLTFEGTNPPPAWSKTVTKSIHAIFAKVQISGTGGNILRNGTPATVAIKNGFDSIVKPSTIESACTYQWKIDGNDLPSTDVAIKTYFHKVDDPTAHSVQDLVAADMQAKGISFFWTKDTGSSNLVTPQLLVEATAYTKKGTAEIGINLTQDADPNRNIYSTNTPSNDTNPNGPSDVYTTLTTHANWHPSRDPKIGGASYPGLEFFDFHHNLVEAHKMWRNTFHIHAIFTPKDSEPITPDYTYLLPAGGTNKSTVYEYVRLGEYANREELGDDTVDPYHDEGHMHDGDPDMTSPGTAPHAADSVFWRWHQRIDQLNIHPDKALVVAKVPDHGATLKAPNKIVIRFDLPVSVNAPPLNTAQIKAENLVVNGTPATSVTTSDFREFTFSIAPPAAGTVSVNLNGTRGVNSSSWSFTVTP